VQTQNDLTTETNLDTANVYPYAAGMGGVSVQSAAGFQGAHVFLHLSGISGLVAGWAAGKIMKGSGYGLVMDLALGVIGSIIGTWIMHVLGFYSTGGLVPNILVAILELSW